MNTTTGSSLAEKNAGWFRACVENRFEVAQATRLCRPATRRTERQQRFEPTGAAFSQSDSPQFRSAGRRPKRASRPLYPLQLFFSGELSSWFWLEFIGLFANRLRFFPERLGFG